jgi:hypothetical protein
MIYDKPGNIVSIYGSVRDYFGWGGIYLNAGGYLFFQCNQYESISHSSQMENNMT